MKPLINYSSQFKILKGGKISLIVSALLGSSITSYANPSGGHITSGNASISQNGKVTNINQSSSKASINWQNFSIASGESVNFKQPSTSSITLNRVIGNEKSIINGALNANGQVWLLNSNGVLFGKNASINTAGLLATTAQLSDTDFQNGNYTFTNATSQSIINQGTITISDAGSVVLASNEVRNEGTIQAVKGSIHLIGADSYSLNLNGNSLLNLTINKGVLDSMVENSGTIIADGGDIYLTTNAVDELLKGVVNNDGILQARTFDDLEGNIIAFAHGGTMRAGGRFDATAPNGGKGGFIETSGREFIYDGADIKGGEWLIDPVDITIDATLAGAIGTALNTGDVTITTAGGNTPDTSGGESGSNGDIIVNSAITKSAGTTTKLTLAADRDISVNAAISGSNGSPLDIVLASRYTGGTLGGVYIAANLQSYGGDITIGGGNINATDYAIMHSSTPYGDNMAGVFISQAIIDATGDGSGTADSTMPTATSGGNIAIRGKGDLTTSHQFNSGVYFYQGKTIGITTGGTGSIDIVGYGGKADDHHWDVAAVGVLWESVNTYIKAKSGDVTIKGYAGTGSDRFGIASRATFIGTDGYLNIEGDSYMLRGGPLSLYVGGSGDFRAPILLNGANTLSKTGSGILNLFGNAKEWHESTAEWNIQSSFPGNSSGTGTRDTATNGIFTDASDSINLVNLTREEALYAFITVPGTVTTVAQSSATALGGTALSYTLNTSSDPYAYTGTAYNLTDYWSASSIFGASYSSWVLGTDYNFIYNGNAVTNFTDAGTYSPITIGILKSGYKVAGAGNTSGSFIIASAASSSSSSSSPSSASSTSSGSSTSSTPSPGSSSSSSTSTPTSKPAESSTIGSIEEVITPITNTIDTAVEVPNTVTTFQSTIETTAQSITTANPTTTYTVSPNMTTISALGLTTGSKVVVLSKPQDDQPVVRMSMADLKAMQTDSETNTDQISSTEIETGSTTTIESLTEDNQQATDTPQLDEIRVPLGENHIVDLVNGGVNLPEGVDQEFYVVTSDEE